MVTKASHIHFTNCKEYADNIMKMGESEWRVENIGSLAIDKLVNGKSIDKDNLFNELGLIKSKPVVLMTYHPVTLEYGIDAISQINNIFTAIKEFNFQVVITSPNIEIDSYIIKEHIDSWVAKDNNFHFFQSLGVKKYQNLIPHCIFVLGNSSSGIIEVPFFKIPTVNIGDRQKGRVRHQSIIDVDYATESITEGIEKAMSISFKKGISSMLYKFGNGGAAKKIIDKLKSLDVNQNLLRKELDL